MIKAIIIYVSLLLLPYVLVMDVCYGSAKILAKAEEKIHSRIESKISKYISPEDYYLQVKLSLKESEVENRLALPYSLKKNLLFDQMTFYDFLEILENANIKLMLKEDLDEESKKFLKQLISDVFQSIDGSMIKIEMLKLPLKFEKKIASSSKSESKSELEKLKNKEDEIKAKIVDQQWEKSKFYISVGLVTFGFLLGFLVLLFHGKSLRFLGLNISESLVNSAESISNSLQSSAQFEASQPDDHSQKLLQKEGGNNSSISIRESQEKLISLHKEINDLLQESNTERIIIEYFNECLSDSNHLEETILTMELIGRQAMSKIFEKICSQGQMKIVNYFNKGLNSTENRARKMIEGGEKIRSFIYTSQVIKVRGNKNGNVTRLIKEFDPKGLSKIIQGFSQEEQARIAFHSDQNFLKEIIVYLSDNEEKLNFFLESLTKIPKVESAIDFDDDIIKKLQEAIDLKNENEFIPYMEYYLALVDSLDNSSKEIAKSVIGQADTSLHKYLELNIITFDSINRFNEESIDYLISKCSNNHIACLILQLDESKSSHVKSSLSSKQLEIIEEEISTYDMLGDKERSTKLSEMKNSIVNMAKDLHKQNKISLEEADERNIKLAS